MPLSFLAPAEPYVVPSKSPNTSVTEEAHVSACLAGIGVANAQEHGTQYQDEIKRALGAS